MAGGVGGHRVEITTTFRPESRAEWRAWLAAHGGSEPCIWLLLAKGGPLSYLDAVEEALCYGWIDGIAKRFDEECLAQRFSPRRAGGNWTELNKARVRRLRDLGLMTPAGEAVLPDMTIVDEVPAPVAEALQAAPGALEYFLNCPALYRRVRAGNVMDVVRQPEEFARRLRNLVEKCAAGKMYGDWNDGGRLRD